MLKCANGIRKVYYQQPIIAFKTFPHNENKAVAINTFQ